jgi:hypothetical protein
VFKSFEFSSLVGTWFFCGKVLWRLMRIVTSERVGERYEPSAFGE